MSRSDIIAAISTPPGKGGVAVIRVSGAGAIALAEKIFAPLSGKAVSDYPARTQIYGYIISDGRRIDDGMLTYFKEGASYTGEETVEISCHGGILITELVLSAVLAAGSAGDAAGNGIGADVEYLRRNALIDELGSHFGKRSVGTAAHMGTAVDEQDFHLSLLF